MFWSLCVFPNTCFPGSTFDERNFCQTFFPATPQPADALDNVPGDGPAYGFLWSGYPCVLAWATRPNVVLKFFTRRFVLFSGGCQYLADAAKSSRICGSSILAATVLYWRPPASHTNLGEFLKTRRFGYPVTRNLSTGPPGTICGA